jgi:Ca2+-transporting ATPase
MIKIRDSPYSPFFVLFYIGGRRIEVTGAGYQLEGEFREKGTPIDPGKDEPVSLALRISALRNDSTLKTEDGPYRLLGDPTEGALLVAALKAGFSQEALQKEHRRLAELPFQSEKRYMATLHPSGEGKFVAYVKGSMERILEMSRSTLQNVDVRELTPEKKAEIEKVNLECRGRFSQKTSGRSASKNCLNCVPHPLTWWPAGAFLPECPPIFMPG